MKLTSRVSQETLHDLQVPLLCALLLGFPLFGVSQFLIYYELYNDQFGDPARDEALRQVIRTLKIAVRSEDAVACYDSDEIAILSSGPNRDDAFALVNRLPLSMTSTPLTSSFGFATCPNDGEDARKILQVADQRLYQAKTGRTALLKHKLENFYKEKPL